MIEWPIWIAIAGGGALGALFRGLIFRTIEAWSPSNSAGFGSRFGSARSTLAVNILGSLLLGWLLGQDEAPWGASNEILRAFWMTGVCGAVTTFSTLCADAVGLFRKTGRMHGIAVIGANLGFGLAAFALGLAIAL